MLRVVTGLVLTSCLVACGSSPSIPSQNVGVTASNASNEAAVAQKSADPRVNDPTGTPAPADPPPAPKLATPAPKFGNLGMTAAPTDPAPGSTSASATPSRISARHVLVQWMGAQHAPDSVVRSREQAQKVAAEVLRRAKAGDDFARLAIEYSDEPNAGQRGGSVGRFGHGQMVPEFEAVAFKLKVGEISGVVESPFGFHIIQRTE